MAQLLSVIFGLLSAVVMIVGLFPLLGWLEWFALVGCVLGIIFGAFCQKKTGQVINIAVALVAALRLILGGGFL